MLLRLLMIATLMFSVSACGIFGGGSKDDAPEEGAATEETAAEANDGQATDDGLSDEPMDGDKEVSDAGMSAKPVGKPLFERVGGMKALEAFAEKFVDALATHKPLQGNANIVNAMKADQTRHKKLLAEFFCEQSGGPCKYSGRDARTAHAPLKMTSTEWTSIRGLFIRTLKELGVPKPERMELAIIAAKQKKNIVQ